MKVLLLDSVVGSDINGQYQYGKGINDVPDDRAKELIKCGHAEIVEVNQQTSKATVQHTEKRKK